MNCRRLQVPMKSHLKAFSFSVTFKYNIRFSKYRYVLEFSMYLSEAKLYSIVMNSTHYTPMYNVHPFMLKNQILPKKEHTVFNDILYVTKQIKKWKT